MNAESSCTIDVTLLSIRDEHHNFMLLVVAHEYEG